MKIVLLAGGLGTRMREETEYRPKPMVPIGVQPILWHIMKTYSHYNIKDFVICAGYKGDQIREYFRNYETMNTDFTIKIGATSSVITHGELDEVGWSVTISDTGPTTMTGGRIFRIKKYLENETFMCTYGDGVADVDIEELLKFHKSHGRIATLTTVQPTSRFGVLDIEEDGSIQQFREKPISDGWINAGYFVFEPEVFDYLSEDCILEREPLAQLAANSQLMAYKHKGFWQPMDTYRESVLLNSLWEEGKAPWKIWN
jgi:glucose-1-phosphate cytidylyltransferase